MLHGIAVEHNRLKYEIELGPIDPQDKQFVENIIRNNPDITKIGHDRTADFAVLEIQRAIELSPGYRINSVSYSFGGKLFSRWWYIYYRDNEK